MKRLAPWLLAAAVSAVQAQSAPVDLWAASGPAIKRIANMPDGAPAFDVIDARGVRISRIACIWNGWYESDALAARLLGAPGVMAAVVARRGLLRIEDLGPATFDCVVVDNRSPGDKR